MLGYSVQERSIRRLDKLLCGNDNNIINGEQFFRDLKYGKIHNEQREVKLRTTKDEVIDVLLFTSEISFGEKSGYTIIVKDLSNQKEISDQLDETKEKFNTLTNIINIGVFRTTLGRRGKIVEANNAALELLGYKSLESIYEVNIFDLFHERDDRKNIKSISTRRKLYSG